jgi:hypothetical protein
MVQPNEYFCSEDRLLCVRTGRKLAEENSMLWQQELVLLTDRYSYKYDLHYYIMGCATKIDGLFGQLPIGRERGNKEDYTSPDQLIAILSHFYSVNRYQCTLIWKYLRTHWFTYDNLSGKTNIQRLQQPQVVLFAAICSGHTYLIPLLSIACLISCMAKERDTSGKLKSWVMMRTLKMRLTYRICTWLVKDWNIVSGIYFHQENHPLQMIAP